MQNFPIFAVYNTIMLLSFRVGFRNILKNGNLSMILDIGLDKKCLKINLIRKLYIK